MMEKYEFFVKTSKYDSKPQSAIKNIKARFTMSKGDPKCPRAS